MKTTIIMNTLIKGIEMVMKNAIEEYSNIISNKFNINPEDLEKIWNDVSEEIQISVSKTKTNSKKIAKVPSLSSQENEENEEKNNNIINGCPYVFTKGAREKETCGAPSKNGNSYCGRHKKYEGTTPKTKKIIPKAGPVKSINTVSSSKKVTSPSDSVRKIFKMNNTINKLVHEETGLILKSSSNRVVVGCFKDGKECPLNSSDIDNCKKYGLNYEIEEEEKEEEEEEEEEVSEENEKIIVKKVNPAQLNNKHNKINLKPGKAEGLKNALINTINHTALQAADVEDVLKELKNGSDEESESNLSNNEFEEEEDSDN